MDNILRFNLSACYEGLGWTSSLVCIEPEVNDGWTKKFGDCRSVMENLNAKSAFKFLRTELGAYYSYIIPNSACSRNGIIQFSIFVPIGTKIENAGFVINALKEAEAMLPTDKNKLKAFFEKNTDTLAQYRSEIEILISKIPTVPQEEISNFTGIFTAEKKNIAYRRYKDEGELYSLLNTVYQKKYTSYSAIFFVDTKVVPEDVCEELNEPLQKLFTVDYNDHTVGYVLEGDEINVQLLKYKDNQDVQPRILTVKADGKKSKGYAVKNESIFIHDSEIDFTRIERVRLSVPEEVSQEDIPMVHVKEGDKNIEISDEKLIGSVYEFSFKQHLNKHYTITLSHGELGFLGKKSIVLEAGSLHNLEDELKYLTKKFRVILEKDSDAEDTYSKKSNAIKYSTTLTAIRVRIFNGNTEIHADSLGYYTIDKDSSYTLRLPERSDYELIKDSTCFNMSQVEDHKYVAYVKNRQMVLSTFINHVKLSGTTNLIDVEDKKFGNIKLHKYGDNGEERRICLVSSRWRILAQVFMILFALTFIATTILTILLILQESGK